jgi:hypothetical protein
MAHPKSIEVVDQAITLPRIVDGVALEIVHGRVDFFVSPTQPLLRPLLIA